MATGGKQNVATGNSSAGNIDRILNYLGNVGRYQLEIFFLSLLPVFIAGMLSTSFVFTTAIPEHRCLVPQCDRIPDTSSILIPQSKAELFDQTYLSFSLPSKKVKNHRSYNQYDTCHIYPNKPNSPNDSCIESSFDVNSTAIDCDKYIYNQEYFISTVATEFGLLCQSEWIIQVLQSIFFFGVLVGAVVNGILADKLGRRMIFRIYSPVTTVAVLISMLSPSLYFYAVGLFIKGLCVAAIYQSAFTLGIECLGGGWRFWLGNAYSVVFASGGIYASLMAWAFRSWQQIEATNLVIVFMMLPYPFLVAESIRWQFSAGQAANALIQVSNAAQKNGVDIPDEVIEQYLVHINRPRDSINEKPDVSMMDLFTHRLIRRWTITFLYIWFTNALVYYGFSFLASEINPNIYLSMVALMAVEFPGVLITCYLGEYTRRLVLIGIMILGGIACIVCSFVQPGQLKMWLAIIGKMSISGSFGLIYVYAAEIFPTILRITGLGMCSFCARLGAMIAPYLLRLHLFGDSFPFLVIGSITLLAGFSSFILPETRGKKLPDTLEEVEQLKYSAAYHSSKDYQTNTNTTTTKQPTMIEMSDDEGRNLLKH